jgi:DNA-binding response OmpR family regulator
VLVVDDEAHIRRIVEFKLKNAGYRVLVATNGEEGLEVIRSVRPDAVVADIMMPRMDGKTLCETTDKLKADRPFLTVMLTARMNPDEHKWVAKMRDTVFMEKPFSPNRLLECVDEYLGVQR